MAKLHLAQEILDIIYPVGLIYLSWNSTNPSTYFGGTWTQLKGGFLYGFVEGPGTGNGTGTATNANNSNTGSTTLTVDQMPSHDHEFPDRMMVWDAGAYNSDAMQDNVWDSTLQFKPWGSRIGKTGGGKGHTYTLGNHSHNIPYIAVSIWRRTA